MTRTDTETKLINIETKLIDIETKLIDTETKLIDTDTELTDSLQYSYDSVLHKYDLKYNSEDEIFKPNPPLIAWVCHKAPRLFSLFSKNYFNPFAAGYLIVSTV